MHDYELIDTAEQVETLASRLQRERVIAIDTEADSFFHYFDKICLLQIGTRKGNYLVDPLALPEKGLSPLEPILADPGIRKVLHAAEYDLYVLNRYGGLKVRNLFDTMVSAQLLGHPAVGLAALVERHFQIQLSKDQQRTDWSRRPLRPAQIEYAVADVVYLIEISNRLEKELRAKKRLDWARAEFVSLEERTWPEREFDKKGYLRIKGAKKLTPQGLAVLRELYLMRDRRAREQDRPPFKVLGNGTLLELAQQPPTSKRALAGRKGVTDLVLRRLGNELLEAVRRGVEGPEHPPLERKTQNPSRRRLDRRGEQRLERLKRWRAERAEELELDPGVFCPNTALEEIAAAQPTSIDDLQRLDHVKPWWAEAFGAEVFRTLAAEPAAPEGSPEGKAADQQAPAKRSGRRRGRKRRSGRKGRASG